MLCVDCGDDVTGLVDGSCPACFVKKTRLLQAPEVVVLETCAHCNARHVGGHWYEQEEGTPLEWVQEQAVRESAGVHHAVEGAWIELASQAQDERNIRYEMTVNGTIDDVEVTDAAALTLRLRRGVCDRCSRIAGGYFAGIIQARATDRPMTDRELEISHGIVSSELDRQRVAGNRFAFLAKSGAEHGGYDYYIGDIEAARSVCRVLHQRLGATVQESPKLVGRKEGVDVYRVTFLVRIRMLANGDFIVQDGKPYQVNSVDRGRVTCIDVARNSRTRVAEKGVLRLGGPEILEEAVVVSHIPGQRDVQVLDPVTNLTRDVLCPDGIGDLSTTVWLLRVDDELFLAPNQNWATKNQ